MSFTSATSLSVEISLNHIYLLFQVYGYYVLGILLILGLGRMSYNRFWQAKNPKRDYYCLTCRLSERYDSDDSLG
jgi:hypothetical protein